MSTESINRRIARRACVYWNRIKRKCVKSTPEKPLKCTTVLQPCFKSISDAMRTDEERAENDATKKAYQDKYLKLQEETKQAVGKSV